MTDFSIISNLHMCHIEKFAIKKTYGAVSFMQNLRTLMRFFSEKLSW